jgi:hypothetical protein
MQEDRASTWETGLMTRGMAMGCTQMSMVTFSPGNGNMMLSMEKASILIIRLKSVRDDYILKEKYKKSMNDSIVYFITNKLLLLLTHLFIFLCF